MYHILTECRLDSLALLNKIPEYQRGSQPHCMQEVTSTDMENKSEEGTFEIRNPKCSYRLLKNNRHVGISFANTVFLSNM